VNRLKTGVVVALLSAGVLAGCGGEDSTPQSKEQFIAEADVVCAGVAEDLRRKGATEPETAQEIAQANNILADTYGKLGEGLSKIELPVGADRRGAQAYVDSVSRTDPLLGKLKSSSRALVEAVNGSDRRALTIAANDVRAALDGFRKARADSDLLAVRYGLDVCGNLG
jgi:hypothetical protein